MSCIVCESKNVKKLYKSLLKCLNCGFVWANLDISEKEIVKIYDDNYFFGGEYADYLQEKPALQKNFKRNLRIISKFVPSGRLLEIGCAYGFFLDLARQQYEVQGIDINENACKYAREQLNLDVVCGDFLEIEFKESYYDIIVSWATLEHLKNPHLYIEKVSHLLKKKGIFACTTCDIDSFLSKIRKSKWRVIHPPTHLNYYSIATLKKLFAKYNMDEIYTSRIGQYRTINSVLYKIFTQYPCFYKFYSMLKKLELDKWCFYLNTFDVIFMCAIKK